MVNEEKLVKARENENKFTYKRKFTEIDNKISEVKIEDIDNDIEDKRKSFEDCNSRLIRDLYKTIKYK